MSVSKRCREPVGFCKVAAMIECGFLYGEKLKLVRIGGWHITSCNYRSTNLKEAKRNWKKHVFNSFLKANEKK